MTTRTPTPPPLDDALEALLRRMRLPHIRRAAPEVLATAKAQRWDPAEVLRVLLTEEVAGRDRSGNIVLFHVSQSLLSRSKTSLRRSFRLARSRGS